MTPDSWTSDALMTRTCGFIPWMVAGAPSVTWADASKEALCLLTPDNQNRRIIDRAVRAAGCAVVPLAEPMIQHSVGLIAVDRATVSPLVLAAFECARAIEPPPTSRPR